MGTIQTKQSIPNKQNFDLLDYGYCIVWKRKSDKLQVMQQYSIQIQTTQRLLSYENMWPLRTKHPFLVNIHYFSHQKTSDLCGKLAQGQIFTQRIPYRLSQFSKIPLKQSILILQKALQIYQILYQNMGLFLVRSTMIGLTQDFQIKIWYHTDYSQPQPQNQNCQSIQQMIQSIIQSIQSTGQLLYYNYKFSDFIAQQNQKYKNSSFYTFKYVQKKLNQYINKFNININTNTNSNLQSIRLYKKIPQGWEKFKNKHNYTVFVPRNHNRNLNNFIQKNIYHQNHNHNLNNNLNQNSYPYRNYNHKNKASVNIQSFQLKNKGKSFYQYLGDNTTDNSRIATVNKTNETNQRGFIQNNQIQQKQSLSYQRETLVNNRLFLANFKNLNLNPQIPKIQHQTFRFWKSNQKVVTHTPVKSQKSNKNLTLYQNSPNLKPKIQTSNFNINKFSQYYQVNQPQKFNYSYENNLKRKNNMYNSEKSAEVSTTTQNYDRSSRSSISLIQDLQFKQKGIKKALNFKKI